MVLGRIPVLECLRAGRRRPERLCVLRDAKGLREIEEAAGGISIGRYSRKELDAFSHGSTHQGVILFAAPLRVMALQEWLESASDPPSLAIVLDGVQDPQNFGGIIRSAVACGADAIIFPKDRAAPLSATTVKAAAGAIEHIGLVRATNLVRAIDGLKDAGFWVAALSPDAEKPLWEADFKGPTAVVVGNEGSGIRPLVLRHCDLSVSIPLPGPVPSLNASVAVGLALGEILRQRA